MEFFSKLIHLAFSKTAKNTYLVFLGNILSAFFAFLFTIILVRKLSFADFGYFSAILSFLLLVSELADLGIGNSLSAFLPPWEKQKERLFSFLKSAFNLQCLLAVSIALTTFIFSSQLSVLLFHSIDQEILFKIAAFGLLALIMGNFLQNTLSARQKFFQVSFLSAVMGLIRLIFLLLLIFLSNVSMINVIWIQILTFIVFTFISFKLVGFQFLTSKRVKGDVKNLFSFTYFLGIARGLTALAGKLDVLMLIAFTNATQAGIYSTAARVISIFPLLSGSFSNVIAPRFSALSQKKFPKEFISKVILVTTGFIISVIILIFLAQPLMVILFGEKVRPTVPVLQLLLISMIFFIASVPAVGLSVYYLRKPQILTVNSILQLIIVVLGNLYFIPRYSLLGPAYSLILSYGLSFVLTTYLSYYYLKQRKYD